MGEWVAICYDSVSLFHIRLAVCFGSMEVCCYCSGLGGSLSMMTIAFLGCICTGWMGRDGDAAAVVSIVVYVTSHLLKFDTCYQAIICTT